MLSVMYITEECRPSLRDEAGGLLSTRFLAGCPLLRMLGQATVSGCDLQHLAPSGRVGHSFGLKPGFLSTVQPILRIVSLGRHINQNPRTPMLQRTREP